MPLQDQPQIENFDFWDNVDGDISALPEQVIGDSIDEEQQVSSSKEQDLKRSTYSTKQLRPHLNWASGFGDFSTSFEDRFSPAVNQWFQQNFPDLGPSVPKAAERKLEAGVSNPFALDQVIVHPRMKSRPVMPAWRSEGAVDGFIKFRYHFKQGAAATARRNASSDPADNASEQQDNPFLNPCPNLPKDFGRGMKLSATDASLLKFCRYPETILKLWYFLRLHRHSGLLFGENTPPRVEWLSQRYYSHGCEQSLCQARSACPFCDVCS